VSKNMGYRIDARQVTMAEFLAMNEAMEREIEAVKKAAKR